MGAILGLLKAQAGTCIEFPGGRLASSEMPLVGEDTRSITHRDDPGITKREHGHFLDEFIFGQQVPIKR